MPSFDCPICGRSQSAEPTSIGREAYCRGCHALFELAEGDYARLIRRKKPSGLEDADFGGELLPPQPRRIGAFFAGACALMALLILALMFLTSVSSKQTSSDTASASPSKVDEPSIATTDAEPRAADAPLVDPSAFRKPEFYPR